MATKTYEPRVEEVTKVWTPDAKLYVPHGNREIAFASPSFGSNFYQKVGKEILAHNLGLPTGDYTASLLHPAYCDSRVSENPRFRNVRELMRSNWLWVFNQNLWTDKGVYVIQDLKAKGRSEEFDSEKLKKLERLVNAKGIREVNGVRFSKDGKVRFASTGTYKLGEHTPESLRTDGFVIAGYDLDGARKLSEVSSKIGKNPITYGVEVAEGNNPELRISALVVGDSRLHVGGDDWGGNYWCHAFGVLK